MDIPQTLLEKKKALEDAANEIKQTYLAHQAEIQAGLGWYQRNGWWVMLIVTAILIAVISSLSFYAYKMKAESDTMREQAITEIQKRIDELSNRIEDNKKSTAVVNSNASKTSKGQTVYSDFSKADAALKEAMGGSK